MKKLIIGISGKKRVGKDTVGALLAKEHFTCIALADPIKRFCAEVFDWDRDTLWGNNDKKEREDKRYVRYAIDVPPDLIETNYVYLTPRHALQQLGTEWGRACYPDVWVEYGMRVAHRLITEEGLCYSAHHDGNGLYSVPARVTRHGVVITDVRFPNEVDAIKRLGGHVMRIVRPGVANDDTHASETALDNYPWLSADIILNDGTIGELEHKVHNWLARKRGATL